MQHALIIGATSAIAQAITAQLQANNVNVHGLSRDNTRFDEAGLAEKAKSFKADKVQFQLIINCIGVLHNERLQPEKRLSAISEEGLSEYFKVNAIIPALCLKAFVPLLDKSDGTFATLSAMVGSIGDNKVGGWYGYRSSKAALNMLIKTTAIESQRRKAKHCIVAIHPGTTKSELSEPFSSNVDNSKYYTPKQTAERILNVIDNLSPENTGEFRNWDGSHIQW